MPSFQCPDCGAPLAAHELRSAGDERRRDVLYHVQRGEPCWKTLERITADMREAIEPSPGGLPRGLPREKKRRGSS